MTHAPSPTLEEARARYFADNGFGPDGGYGARWVHVRVLDRLPMAFPNTPARVRAVRFHDLHHVLTGYRTDFAGEVEISAWEVAGGCARHWAAWGLNLGGMGLGLLWRPGAVWRAFVRGRHSRNLYREAFGPALLARRVDEARGALGLDRPARPASARDALAFLGWGALALGATLLMHALLLLAPLALLAWGLVRLM